ncbi:MAG: hypothetical protein AB7G16_00900 [Simkaniaceae bacterium]
MKAIFKVVLFLVFPLSIWGDYLFVLYDAGETVALEPVIEALQKRGEEVEVLRYGMKGRYEELSLEELSDADVVVTGTASKIQLQHIQHAQGKTVAYYDNALPIETLSYALLIREFEEAADLFLVPSQVASASSHAKHVEVVGNPDLDRYQGSEMQKGVLTYFGGYDPDYEAAFRAFLNYVAPLEYQVVVRPHPKTDGSLEKKLIEGMPNISLGDPHLSAVEAVAQSEMIVCHRSSMAVKAAAAGKKVLCIDAEGRITYPPSREELGIPSDATERIVSFLL